MILKSKPNSSLISKTIILNFICSLQYLTFSLLNYALYLNCVCFDIISSFLHLYDHAISQNFKVKQSFSDNNQEHDDSGDFGEDENNIQPAFQKSSGFNRDAPQKSQPTGAQLDGAK